MVKVKNCLELGKLCVINVDPYKLAVVRRKIVICFKPLLLVNLVRKNKHVMMDDLISA